MLGSLVFAAASIVTTVVPATHVPRAHLSCSATYGCEVVIIGERARDVTMTSTSISARQVNTGDDGGPIWVQLLPSGAFAAGPDGAMATVTGKLTVLTESNREFVVIVDATDLPIVRRIVFDNIASTPHPIPIVSVGDARASGESAPLDPAKMDFGWRSDGDIRCLSAFSVGLQLWCVLPRSSETPSVYFDDGRLKEPANARIVAQRFLVIENGATKTILLELGGGHPRSGHIVRTAE